VLNNNSHNAAHLDGRVVPMSEFAGIVSTCPLDESLWHRRFCHLNRGDVRKLMQGTLATGIVVNSKESMDPICEPCIAGKQHRVAVPKVAQHRSSKPLELVHSDVHGPLPVRSRHHSRYWITFIDDASRYWVVLPLQDKAGAFAAFKQFKALAENQLNCKIKALRDDKGGEYMSTEWESFCSANGIVRQHTVRAEPHQNGVAERANRTIMEAIISMLNESKLPGSFWWDALAAFVHVHNCSPTASNSNNLTPFELWHKSKPDVSHFRVFGCTSFVHVKKDKRKQLQSHTQKCVFIGYPSNYKAWLFWNPVTKKEVVSNSAEFDECFFPGTSTKPIDWPLPTLTPSNFGLPQEPVEAVGDNSDVFPLPPSHSGPVPDSGVGVKPEEETVSTPDQEPPQMPAQQQEQQQRSQTPPPPSTPGPSTPVQSPQQSPPAPSTPVQSPKQQEESQKRQLLSPASDISSPEHKAPRQQPRPKPRPKAPETTAEPMSNFRPANIGPQGRFSTMRSYTHLLPRRGESSTQEPLHFDFRPQDFAQSIPKENEEMEDEEDIPRDTSSPDPMDLFNQEDALVTQLLLHLADAVPNEWNCLSLEEAFEYALASKLQTGKPSEPTHWKDIAGRPDADKWHAAVLEEFTALLDNGTFEPIHLPAGRKAIGCRWVFKLKRKPDGTVDRYKARLVAKGFSQRPGLDFGQVFTPTARWAALRAIFALAATEDLEMHSLDISNAFLNGDLDHEVYMQQPEGFQDRFGAGFVLKLNRALYGLKQAGHQWHKKLDSVLTSLDFKLVRCDNSIWVYHNGDVRVIVPVYVDDMTVVFKTTAQYESLVKELEKHFKLKRLGPTSALLGVSIARDRSKRLLTLSQRQYIVDVLNTFGFGEVRPVATPLEPGMRLSKDQAPSTDAERTEMRTIPYSQLVGALMYLAVATRPDIAHSVGVLARFNANPGLAHWRALKHLCRYLQGTKDVKLCYQPDPQQPETFVTYADADYAGDVDDRRSTSGLVVKMGTGAISWASKLQPVVTLSTTEAEYISAVAAGQEICWLRNLFSELGYAIKGASSLHLDNQSAIAVSRNPEHHGRMKHLDLRHYWLRDYVKSGHINVKYIPTTSMPADIMTKSLPKATVLEMRELLGLRS
jgi:hypothetical protein